MHGGSINMAKILIEANMAAGVDMKGINFEAFGVKKPVEAPKPQSVDAEWFKGKRDDGRIYSNPKWHEIAKAYLAMESATTVDQMIQAIDRLNDLQHNSFHLLIDLQTGRMMDQTGTAHDEAFNIVHDVLDIKAKARSPFAYQDKLSREFSEMLTPYRHLFKK
jgi:hypothetical protein